MSDPKLPEVESDPRFPSGKWAGFFTQKYPPIGKHQMEMEITFADGRLTGRGRDYVGEFVMDGVYHLDDGKCSWAKEYIGQHTVNYHGYNEGKGIWGTWEIVSLTGGFHIWPEGMGNPSEPGLSAEADVPAEPQLAGV